MLNETELFHNNGMEILNYAVIGKRGPLRSTVPGLQNAIRDADKYDVPKL